MDKIETLEKIRRILYNVGDKMLLLTSGNLSHNLAIHRATIYNVRHYLIPRAMNLVNDAKTEGILAAIDHNLEAIGDKMVSVLSSPHHFTKLQAVHLNMSLKTNAKLLDNCIKKKSFIG